MAEAAATAANEARVAAQQARVAAEDQADQAQVAQGAALLAQGAAVAARTASETAELQARQQANAATAASDAARNILAQIQAAQANIEATIAGAPAPIAGAAAPAVVLPPGDINMDFDAPPPAMPPLDVRAMQEVSNLLKIMPKYNMTEQSWNQYITGFRTTASMYTNVQGNHLKVVLFSSLSGMAQKLAAVSHVPTNPTFAGTTFQQYVDSLGLIYNPPAQSQRMRNLFYARVQSKLESVEIYLQDKQSLFLQGWPAGQRNYQDFVEAFLKGIHNELLKNKLRYNLPMQQDLVQLRSRTLEIIALMHGEYLAGSLTSHDIEGTGLATNPSAALMSSDPAAVSGPAVKVKTEATHHVHAMTKGGNTSSRKCYWCGSSRHLVGSCDRRSSGLPPCAKLVDLENAVSDGAAALHPVHAIRRTSYSTRPRDGKGRYKSRKKWQRGDVLLVYTDNDGGTHETVLDSFEPDEETSSDEDEQTPEVSSITKSVHSLKLDSGRADDGSSDEDHTPHPFFLV